ncbi:DNA-directed RNA polymerase specialized sigma24 family protein [Kitasatospora viridis]|uniref:DNA-directed RNA polymerase specialized sigma24 family protein n=2 Tax=Kitasatospora viridis TaxID=281105 RepID=A0A561UIT2_9ACTN|nr:DNA-directed RNA polymerase specialized sigma24 family protein [Kitasatospora viridis]
MPTAYQRLLDGLYTYCLSVLCDPAEAGAAVGEVRELVDSGGERLTDPALRRAWLYSAARYACVRRLAAGAAGDRAGGPVDDPAGLRAELAALAWPEAAGTTAEQREALELTLRHHLTEEELAAVLGLDPAATGRLLAGARAELATTRRALLVLGVGTCPELDRLGGPGAEHWRGWVLGPALRRELVRHVEQCPTCRGTAERVAGFDGGPPAGLALLAAPAGVRAGGGGGAGVPVFDARGLPRHRAPGLLERHRAGGDLHERLVLARQRLVSTGVLAAVLSAPLAALWVAHRDGAPVAGAASVSSVRVDTPPDGEAPAVPPVPAAPGRPTGTGGDGRGLVAALVGAASGAGGGAAGAETLLPPVQASAVPVPATGAVPISSPQWHPEPVPAAAALDVTAGSYGSRTVLTLTNTGGTALDWHAELSCDWLRLSRDAGTLAPGQRITVIVTVDDQHAPDADWTAWIALPPSSAVVTLTGGPDRRGLPSPSASPSAPDGTTPSPSANPSGSASATPSDTPSAGSSASSPPSSSESPSASPTSGPSTQPSASRSASSSPSATPSIRPSSNPPTPSTAPATSSATSDTSPSSPR